MKVKSPRALLRSLPDTWYVLTPWERVLAVPAIPLMLLFCWFPLWVWQSVRQAVQKDA